MSIIGIIHLFLYAELLEDRFFKKNMTPKSNAPEQIRIDVKLAASISAPPNAKRHKIELEAKAIMASVVNNIIFIWFIGFKKKLIFYPVVGIVQS